MISTPLELVPGQFANTAGFESILSVYSKIPLLCDRHHIQALWKLLEGAHRIEKRTSRLQGKEQ
jgi:hypothetical protein